MGPVTTDGLAHLLMLGFITAVFLGGVIAGFGLSSIINLGKLCL